MRMSNGKNAQRTCCFVLGFPSFFLLLLVTTSRVVESSAFHSNSRAAFKIRGGTRISTRRSISQGCRKKKGLNGRKIESKLCGCRLNFCGVDIFDPYPSSFSACRVRDADAGWSWVGGHSRKKYPIAGWCVGPLRFPERFDVRVRVGRGFYFW